MAILTKSIKRTAFGLLVFFLPILLIGPSGLSGPAPSPVPSGPVDSAPNPKPPAAGTAPDFSNKNILLLHAYTYETASNIIMDPILVQGFLQAGLNGNGLHFEFLDLSKHPEPGHRLAFAHYLARKYKGQKIDLILALLPGALGFLAEEGKDLFPGVPVINVIGDPDFLENQEFREAQVRRLQRLRRPQVILPFAIRADATVRNLLGLRPETRSLVVISGSDLLDRKMEQTVRRSLQAWPGRLPIEYWSGLPLKEVLARVAALTPSAAVLFTSFAADPEGNTYRPYDVVRRISKVSRVPVFGLFDSLLGNTGIVGGTMPSIGREAERAVGLSLEILGGKLPAESVTLAPAPTFPLFDWEQLQRWGLEEEKLPRGSIVRNRPQTIWSEYRELVIAGLAIMLVQTVLVTGLLVQRQRKKKAEASLRKKTEELDQFFNVALDLLCIANFEGYFLRLNPVAEKILGYSREELLTRPFFSFIHPDEQDDTRKAVFNLETQQEVLSFENRFRCKDGTYRWLEWTAAPAGNLIFAAARDVTERKLVEQSLQENARVLRRNQTELRELTGRLISAQEEERRYLARELHDDLTQRLAVLSIDAEKVNQLLAGSPGPVREKLSAMKEQLVKIAGDINSLARQLHPSLLDDLGLVRAVESECTAFLKREGVAITFHHENFPEIIDNDVALNLYRIVQEGLRNISKHACAERVFVSLKGAGREIQLSIQDNGIGFDLAGARITPGLGLSSMRERARLINGEFSIAARPGEGTRITVRVSLPQEGAANEKTTPPVGR